MSDLGNCARIDFQILRIIQTKLNIQPQVLYEPVGSNEYKPIQVTMSWDEFCLLVMPHLAGEPPA